jgi:hypothetical protein
VTPIRGADRQGREGLKKKNRLEGFFTLDFVGLSFKEKVIEFFLMGSGGLFYHLILRPMNSIRSRKKKKQQAKQTKQPG